jgi:ParB-like chromosome segregation protein Spo0J
MKTQVAKSANVQSVSLPALEDSIRAIQERVKDREEIIDSLTPQVADGEAKIARLRENVANLDVAVAENVMIGAKSLRINTQIKLKYAEDSLAALKVRLDTSVRILAATRQLSLEWLAVNGELLSKLRTLTPGQRVGDKF